MKLALNKEYARRHLFVTVVMTALGLWFGFDGFIRYPATPAAELYRSIEGSEAPEGFDLEGFKRQKTQTQYGFTTLSLLAALVVGLRLYGSYKFNFEFDDAGFSFNGRKYTYGDIAETDHRLWKTKTILKLRLKDGANVVLDAWHHTGVKEFEAKLVRTK